MVITAIFVFTAAMSIVALFKFIGLIFGNSMSLPAIVPGFNVLAPDHNYVFYPSLMFQIWFWVDRLGVLV